MRPIAALVLALAAVLAAPAVEAEPRGFNVRDLVALDRVSDPQLAPDGRHLAFSLRETDMAADKGVNGIWLLDLATPGAAPVRLTPVGESWSSPRFGGDGRLYASGARSGSSQVWRLDLDGGEAVQVTDYPLGVDAFGLSRDGTRLAVAMAVFTDCDTLGCSKSRQDQRAAGKASGTVYDTLFVRHWDTWKDGTRSQLFVAAIGADGRAGTPVRVSTGLNGDTPPKPFGGDGDFSFSADGESVFFVLRDADAGLEALSTNLDIWQAPADGSTAPVNLTDGNDASDNTPVVSPDGRHLAYLAMSRPMFEADRQRILLRELATGETREIAPDWDRSPGSLAFAPDGKTLYATADDVGQHPLFAIDVATGAVKTLTQAGYVAGVAIGAERIVYGFDDLRSPVDLFAMDPGGENVRRLTRHNVERLADVRFGEFEQFSFYGADGATVYGHVVKPWNFKEGERYPVAFLIHGGPQGSMGNHWHYRWNPQTYAGAGFASVFIDFHGSTGYGQAFTDAIRTDWGGKPLVDLQKGLELALARFDWLDGERVCALGASYGGYMINWIAGNWASPFKCLVNHSGIFDNRTMYYATEELWFDEWEHGGKPYYEDPAAYEKHNPAAHVARWRTPMLVVHGDLDFRVPLEQGISTFTALQRKGVPSRFLRFPNENHWILRPANSILWHDTVNGWLKQWLMPPAAAGDAVPAADDSDAP
jgi:dipeptidyl aminopeptidase/acylaminoacyl peptidase